MTDKVFSPGEVLTAADVNDYLLNKTGSGNAIINGAFEIWQRGTSVAGGASNIYTSDRWRMINVSTYTVSRQPTSDTTNLPEIQFCARYQRNSGSTATTLTIFSQSFETSNSRPFAGKTVTLSFYARAGANFSSAANALRAQVISGTGTDQNVMDGYTGGADVINSTATLTTTWQRFTYTGTVGSTANELGVQFFYTPVGTAGANDFFEITGVQLEAGSVATPFKRNANSLQGELAACQRYFQVFGAGMVGRVNSNTASEILGNFPVTMRATPSIAVVSTGQIFNVGLSSVTGTITISAAVGTVNGMALTITHGGIGGSTPGTAGLVSDCFSASSEL
jgi:hypothetical protein